MCYQNAKGVSSTKIKSPCLYAMNKHICDLIYKRVKRTYMLLLDLLQNIAAQLIKICYFKNKIRSVEDW